MKHSTLKKEQEKRIKNELVVEINICLITKRIELNDKNRVFDGVRT